MAMGLLKNLLREVETKAKSLSPSEFVTKMKLEEAIIYLRDHYFRSPLNFIQNVKTMLERERHLVQLTEHVRSTTTIMKQFSIWLISAA